jgi:hypothetical protein
VVLSPLHVGLLGGHQEGAAGVVAAEVHLQSRGGRGRGEWGGRGGGSLMCRALWWFKHLMSHDGRNVLWGVEGVCNLRVEEEDVEGDLELAPLGLAVT